MKPIVQQLIDHPVRHVLQNTLLNLPLMSKIQMARSTTGAMNDPELMTTWASRVIETAVTNDIDFNGVRLIEIGPGHSLGIAVTLLMKGAAEVMAVDVKPYATTSPIDQFLPIIERCQKIGLIGKNQAVDLAEIVERIRYVIVKDNSNWEIEDASVDIVYSYYSGEHLRSVDQVFGEISRVLKPGGLCIQAIDLRDHYHFEGNWLQFLYYEPWLWEAMSSKRGKWSNRLLAPQWREKFEAYFEILTWEETQSSIPNDFDVSKLAPLFRSYSRDTLSIFHLWVVSRKPLLNS